jgi:CubicO group peptidase (beta-lactamase class C family)
VSGRVRPDLLFSVTDESARLRLVALKRLRAYIASLLADGFPPSVSLAVVAPGGMLVQAYGGRPSLVDETLATVAGTRYDLASLTKVVCTTTLVLRAAERGDLALDDEVVRWLPRYPEPRTTLWHLLTHTSGLVDHVPFYLTGTGRGPMEEALYGAATGPGPGEVVRYSDLNFMLLGWVLEACLGRSLDQSFAAEVAVPMGLEGTGFRPAPADRSLTAATELDGDQRLEPGLVWGEVHDGNAYYLGGVAGHAGLFAPLSDLARFVRALLAPDAVRLLSAQSIAQMSTRRAATAADVRGLGWRLEPKDWGTWPTGTIWHTGFTGTSLLVAPGAGTAVVLLTNSVHPYRRLDDQAAVRAEIHRLVAEALP